MPPINWKYFFKHPKNFPWDLYDGVPMVGMPHVYICRMLVNHFDKSLHGMLRAGTTISHLRSMGDEHQMAKDIVYYCDRLDELPRWERMSTSAEVLGYLASSVSFKRDFEEKIKVLLQNNRIVLKKEAYDFNDGTIMHPDDYHYFY